MHGRPRKPPGEQQDPEKLKAKEKKARQFKQLTNAVMEGVGAERDDRATLAQAAQLLQNNPDVYTVWNHRRRVLQSVLEGDDRDAARQAAVGELKVTENALLENPKSYSAWHHRLWIMRLRLLPLGEELQQIERFLKMDSRNFHAWQYRREIGRMAGVDLEDELRYTRDLIDANFSNYSAWHARSSLLREAQATQQVVSIQDLLSPQAEATGGGRQDAGIPPRELEGEFELVRQAFFTDPEDQSAYFYHRWLLTACMAHLDSAAGLEARASAHHSVAEVLRQEEESCRELIAIETDRFRLKWPLLTLCLLLKLQRKIGVPPSDEAELAGLYEQLIEIDPLRKGFYREAASLDGV